MKKLLALGVIVLFIGLAFAPSIIADLPETKMVEITVEICGTDGMESQKISLSKKDAERLDVLFDETRNKLDNVTSVGETVEIFNDVIVSLDELDSLGDLSVEEAQSLVFDENQNLRWIEPFKRLIKFNNRQDSEIDNTLCLIMGKSTSTYFMSLGGYLSNVIGYYLSQFGLRGLEYFAFFLLFMFQFISMFNLLPVMYMGGLGALIGGSRLSADGWIHTIGLGGIQSINGSFYGTFDLIFLTISCMIWYHPGILGFSGIRLYWDVDNSFYIGSAIDVKISSELPGL